jgi:hypothetical protein
MRHGPLLAAAALLFVAMVPRAAWAHDWGGAPFIAAFIMMIAVPLGLIGLPVGAVGGSGVKTFFGSLLVLAILACVGLWLLLISDQALDLAGHAQVLAPIGLPLLAAWLCLRSPRLADSGEP